MIFLLFASVVFVFFLNILIISIILKNNARRFENTKKKGTAEVIGYDTSEGARWRSLIVKLNDLDDNKRYICNSGKIDIQNYPKRTIIDVIYASSFLGRQVYLTNNMPASKTGVAKVFSIIASFLFVLTLVLAGVGLYQIF